MKMTLRTLFVISLCHFASGLLTCNQTTATEQCKGHGGLASYQHFIEKSEDKVQSLSEGDSVWISGNVKFSKMFVAWYGCYIGNEREIWKYRIAHNNIYNCLESCSGIYDEHISYIGLREEWCYCIKHAQIGNIDARPDKFCKKQLIEPIFFSRDGDSFISAVDVYTVIDHTILFWDPLPPAPFGQCVYNWKNDYGNPGGKIRYRTDSCYTVKDGFICVSNAYRPLSTNCNAVHNDNHQSLAFCPVYISSSWPSSYKECDQYLGNLAAHIYPDIQVYVRPNVTFWTGIFRTFKLDDEDVSEENRVCLSLKKVDNKLMLDPADCSTNKGYICKHSISESTDSALKTTNSHKETESEPKRSFLTTTVSNRHTVSSVTFLSSPTTMLSKEKGTSDGETVPTNIYMAIGVVLTMLTIVITVITCLILRKRRKVRKGEPFVKTRSKDDHKTTATDSDISARSAAVSHCVAQSQVRIHQHNESNEESACATRYEALMQRNVSECEYDSVDVNAPGKSDISARSAAVSHCVAQSQVRIHQHNESTEENACATRYEALIQRNVPESEYDKVDVNTPGKSNDNTATAMHVYANA